MMIKNIRAEKITTSMVPTYMRSLTGGFELGSGSRGECADGGDEVSFITRFTAEIFGAGRPLSLATRVRLYSGWFCFERGAPLTCTVLDSGVTTNLKCPNSLPPSMATLVSPFGPLSSSLTKTIATTVLFGDLSSRLTKRFFELYLSSMRGSCKFVAKFAAAAADLPPAPTETVNAELPILFCCCCCCCCATAASNNRELRSAANSDMH